jgi:putative oxidoreductase
MAENRSTKLAEQAIQPTYCLLRMVVGLFFFQYGAIKMFGWFGGFGHHPGATAPLMSELGLAGVLEVVGGLAILLGISTRPVAFVLSGEMAVAYWQAFGLKQFWPIENNGVTPALFCFIFLFMAAYGGGDWSLDAWIKKRRQLPSGG